MDLNIFVFSMLAAIVGYVFGRLEGYKQGISSDYLIEYLMTKDALLKSCDELEAYINAEYPEYKRGYPHNERSYQVEMNDINNRRELCKAQEKVN
jgi:hypothetical protein